MYGLIKLIPIKTDHPKIQEVHNFVTLLFQCLVALLGGFALLDIWNVPCDTDTFHVCVVFFGGVGGGGGLVTVERSELCGQYFNLFPYYILPRCLFLFIFVWMCTCNNYIPHEQTYSYTEQVKILIQAVCTSFVH